MSDVGRDEFVDDGRIPFPALDHQVGRHGTVGQLAHAMQVGPSFGGQRLDHAEAAAFGHRGREFRPGDVGHRRLDDGVLDVQQGLDAVGHDLILGYR